MNNYCQTFTLKINLVFVLNNFIYENIYGLTYLCAILFYCHRKKGHKYNLNFYLKNVIVCIVVLDSIVVSIPACHAGGRGSIPRRGDFFDSMSSISNTLTYLARDCCGYWFLIRKFLNMSK